MTRNLLIASSCLSLMLASPVVGQASETRLQLPDSVYGFSLTDSSTFPGTGGKAYRYLNLEKVRADVYLYEIPPERFHASDSAQLVSEAELFVTALAYGVDRGHYDTYNVPVNSTVSVEASEGRSIPGRVVVMVFRRGDASFVSFMHLFVKDRTYVKVRLSLPVAEWERSLAPNFALELAKRLFP